MRAAGEANVRTSQYGQAPSGNERKKLGGGEHWLIIENHKENIGSLVQTIVLN